MTAIPDKLKIVRLQAENFKRLKAVEIVPDPDGSLVLITGPNGAGKSSVLDSIMAAVCSGRELPDMPVRVGEKESRIVLDLGELTIERVIGLDGKTKSLKVKSGAGAVYPSPQSLLDGLLGKLAFDPLAFMRLSAKEQVNQLLQVVDLGFDPDELAAQRKALYEERTLAGREVKRLEGALQTMQRPDTPLIDLQEVSVAALTEEFNQLAAKNQQRDAALSLVDTCHREYQNAEYEVGNIKRQIELLKISLKEAEAKAGLGYQRWEEVKAKAYSMPQHDLTELAGQIQNAEQTNARVREARSYYDKLGELTEAGGAQDKLSAQIDALDKRKADALAAANMPVPGLGFTADGLTLADIPLQQASASEQLRVSVAIAMALNPTLRVLTIRDGSLLDSNSMRIIAEQAQGRDYQVWMEQVDETGEVGVVIEGGEVRAEVPDLLEVER